MDIDRCLAEIRLMLVRRSPGRPAGQQAADDDRLAELVEDLDEWLSNGGAVPRAWREPGRAYSGRWSGASVT